MEETEQPESLSLRVSPSVTAETNLERTAPPDNPQSNETTTSNTESFSMQHSIGDVLQEPSQIVLDSDEMMNEEEPSLFVVPPESSTADNATTRENESSSTTDMQIDDNLLEPEMEAVEMMVERDAVINAENEEEMNNADSLVNNNAIEDDVGEDDEHTEEEDMQELAVDIVFNMYDREVEAGASRRHNQINIVRAEFVENRDRFNYPFRSQQLQRIRRALMVIDSNRRFHTGQRALGAISNLEEPSPPAEGADPEPTTPDGPDQEVDGDVVPQNPIRFDTNLAAEHSYLGSNLSRVSGVEYLDVGEEYNMMLFLHQHIVYPGEVLPFMISGTIIDAEVDSTNGMLFGVCFPFMRCNKNENSVYGVTCQIYEKGTDERGHTVIKSRALQRFITTSDTQTEFLEYINDNPRLKNGHIQVLPEIYLPEPLNCIHMGSFNRFRGIPSMARQFQRYQAATTSWPAHIYNYYNISSIVEKARELLAQHKVDTMPTDPIQLSFWLARNLHLPEEVMKKIFMNDTVNLRMKLIESTLQEVSVFVCRICGNRIANCSELFAMSKHGVQTQYCNAAGYIHETNTVYKLLRDAITYSGDPSSKFSWFPGYKWHIVICKVCTRHIGWEFKAMEPNLVPKSFFGISSSSVRVSDSNMVPTDHREEIFRNFMRLARREVF